jgi:flagellar basal-body rod protein FlgC
MNLLKSMMIAASGMTAQGSRMRVIAENLANAGSTAKTRDADPYRRKVPTFKNELDRKLGIDVVKMDKVVKDKSGSYEAGLNVISAARNMMARTIDLLRS